MQFDNSSPIWLQLVAEFGRKIVANEWPSGHRIPGVRELATELGVNPNTVQRALAELERQELCFTERTAGRFVTSDEQRIASARRDLAAEATTEFIARVRGMGIDESAALDLIKTHWNRA